VTWSNYVRVFREPKIKVSCTTLGHAQQVNEGKTLEASGTVLVRRAMPTWIFVALEETCVRKFAENSLETFTH